MSTTTPARRSRVAVTCTATALLTGLTGLAALGTAVAPAQAASPTTTGRAAAATPITGGGYVPLMTPRRAMDTRTGLGLPRAAKIGPGQTATVPLAGRAGVPSGGGASAVVIHLTETGSTAGSYLSAYPADVSRPTVSSLNFAGRSTRGNLVTVPLHADGKVTVYNAVGSTDVVVDVVGYYATAENATYGGLQPVTRGRYDSRADGTPFYDGYNIDLGYDFGGNNPDIRAFVVHLSADRPSAAGYFTTSASGQPDSTTPSLIFPRGTGASNLAIVERGDFTYSGPDGGTFPSMHVAASTGSGSVHLIVDVIGVFTAPGASQDARFVPLSTPQRILDTRTPGTGGPNLAPGEDRSLSADAVGTTGTTALAANIAVAGPSAPTYVTLYPSDFESRPLASSINAARGDVVASGAVIPLAPTPRADSIGFNAFNAAGTTPLMIDVAGTFDAPVIGLGAKRTGASTAWTPVTTHSHTGR
ncbi:hypothetical protein V3N99_06745 [Dermatophilaceae bacterium Soc4.6]